MEYVNTSQQLLTLPSGKGAHGEWVGACAVLEGGLQTFNFMTSKDGYFPVMKATMLCY